MKETKDGVYFDLDEKGFKEKTTPSVWGGDYN